MEKPKSASNPSPRFSFFGRLLDLVAPRFCCICGRRLTPTEEEVCVGCNISLPRTGFAASPTDNLLTRRFWGMFPVERCASLFFYQASSISKRPILRFKYFDHPETAVFFGRAMANEFGRDGFFEDIDLIVPVPLAKVRSKQRGYNQSELLARGMSEVTGIPVEAKAVRRSAFKTSQTHLSRMERFDNVAGLFSVIAPERVAGKRVLIVDDVITTGATTAALAQELIKAGVECVHIACLACTKHL